jgi:hypothetical protein
LRFINGELLCLGGFAFGDWRNHGRIWTHKYGEIMFVEGIACHNPEDVTDILSHWDIG